jgi:hypothetical protein
MQRTMVRYALAASVILAGSASRRLVMGQFTDGPPAGRLRGEGADVPDRGARALQERMAIYAIPRPAVRRRQPSRYQPWNTAGHPGRWSQGQRRSLLSTSDSITQPLCVNASKRKDRLASSMVSSRARIRVQTVPSALRRPHRTRVPVASQRA